MSKGFTSPASSIGLFVLITSLYFVFKYSGSPSNENMYFGIYALILIIGEFIINMGLTSSICGNKQLAVSLYITLVPWILIFGILKVMLTVFPGWLSPFSNTFGYGITRLFGISDLMVSIFKPKLSKADLKKENISAMAEALEHIYSDKSLLINEITPENFDIFWEDMSPLFNDGIKNNADMKEKLYSFIRLKDIVAEYIWYLLSGILVTSVGYNYLVNNGCSQDAKEMQKKHTEYMKNQETVSAANSEKQRRVYTVS